MTELCIWFCPALSKGVKYTPISQACSQSVHVWLSIWFLFFASCVSQVQVDENKVEVVRLRPVFTIATKRMPVTEGVVEVKNKDGWAQICDNGWTPKNSHVVCGMMGFPHEKKVNKNFYKWVFMTCWGLDVGKGSILSIRNWLDCGWLWNHFYTF